MTTKKTSVKIAEKNDKKVKTFEEIQKENQEMRKKLDELLKRNEEKPKTIDEQIKYFEEKKERINKLRLFEETQIKILETIDTLLENKSNDMFTNENFKLIFGTKTSYNNEISRVLVSISNTDLLLNFVENLKIATTAKIEELKKEISL